MGTSKKSISSKESIGFIDQLVRTPSKTTLPESVIILGREVPIEMMPKSWDSAGEFDEHTCKICVQEGQLPTEEADTALHETIHGIDYWLDLELSERQVRLLATALIGLFQDNPEFAEYLTRPMRGTQI